MLTGRPFRGGTGFRNIGLFVTSNDWEYPFWVLLGVPESARALEHVEVTDVSARLGGGIAATPMPSSASVRSASPFRV